MHHPEARLSLRHLRLIDAVERDGSLAAAAVSLNMTQSAVTKALQDAEAAAGVPLFARTGRGAVPTPYGALLVRHARDVIARMRRAGRELADLKSGTGGTVAVGTLPSAAGGLVPDAIARLLAERPGLRVTITEGQHERLTGLLRRGDLDLVVGRLPPRRRPADLAETVLAADQAQLVVRADHPLAGAGGGAAALTLGALRDRQWILPPPDTTMRRQIDAAFHDAGLDPPVPRVESLSFLSNRALLLAGDYITAWPQQLAAIEARRGQVALLPVALPATQRPLGLWWRADAPLSPAAQALADALRKGALSHDPGPPG
ncbi:LysR substrate-binding domain-containing protein [Paracoccus luteus]|uniref:LysR substrate-binding domain-containing protein n=1 Tax=Paracoccus luteus TaxID=2508543 RepID=UPI00106FED0D|nr:LysR substrate-binding domain-containing protein [Paracoccus luteus]